ncbi:hypothetical protein [Jannaschia rubra]|uniref:Uncharacterized protein n=1 Tax=Jannaschia rubra TaxID=282197 RepID=A0A0M6XPI5_9RHOB|nr:hypothetical protein [Jannaschia rubra]CTQ32101.1 hypothetical protein JAN5088_00863 [Jannaschia rubra]SFG37583.1 hypothetical protein SAMN04488517_104131 [Jannaschia rubra]
MTPEGHRAAWAGFAAELRARLAVERDREVRRRLWRAMADARRILDPERGATRADVLLSPPPLLDGLLAREGEAGHPAGDPPMSPDRRA